MPQVGSNLGPKGLSLLELKNGDLNCSATTANQLAVFLFFFTLHLTPRARLPVLGQFHTVAVSSFHD